MARLPERNPDPGRWGIYPDFAALVTGQAPGRTHRDQVSYYRNAGNQGLQFSAVGQIAYRKAREKQLGIEIPTDWFLQNIRD